MVTLALAICGLALGASGALADSTFNWSGTDSNTGWSIGDNWLGDIAPLSNDVGDSLIFPAGLTGGDCTTSQTDACYTPEDDLSGYSISGLTIDDGVGYDIGGSEPLTIGSGGIDATTSSNVFEPSEIDTPITLGASQTWPIDGGRSGVGQLNVDGGITGSTYALGVQLSNVGYLDLGGNNETGAVTLSGSDSSDTGLSAYDNGAVAVDSGGKLNSSDGHTLQLDSAAIFGEGTLGPIKSSGGVITAGDPLGSLTVDGAITLDSSSALQFAVADSGTTPGTDYSQLSTTGNIDLNNAALDITGADASNDCPAFNLGATYTLITTTGTITGTFAGGQEVALDCVGRQPLVALGYGSNTVTATVVGPRSPTVTTLSASPWPPHAGEPLTLTATVTADFGTPAGSIEFGVPEVGIGQGLIQGCSENTPLTQVGSSYQATCTATAGGAGSDAEYTATFTPAAGTDLDGSEGYTPSATVLGPPVALLGTGGAGHASVKGTVTSLPLTCTGASGATCTFNVTEQVIETVKNSSGVVVGVAAKAKAKTSKRTIIVGGTSVTLDAGDNQTVSVALTPQARSLLTKRHSFPAQLLVTFGASGATPYGQTLAFKATPKKVHK